MEAARTTMRHQHMAAKHATGPVGELCSSERVSGDQFSCKILKTLEIILNFKNILTGLEDRMKGIE